MALAKYFLIFTIIFQIGNLSISAQEPSNSNQVIQLGIGGTDSHLTFSNNNDVDSLLSDFLSESSLGFFNTSTGEIPGMAHVAYYGFYLCRGDLSAEQCNDCLTDIRQFVLDQRMAVYYTNGILYNRDLQCVVRYANSSTPFVYRRNSTITGEGFGDNLANYQQYNTTLLNTLQELVREASYGNWTNTNFATRVVDVVGTQEQIYILVQCRPDISAMNCSNCINDLYSSFRPFALGGRVLGFDCLLTYNNETFFGSGSSSFMPSYFHMFLVLLLTMYVTLT